MSKIAAIILPSARADQAPRYQADLRRLLCLAAHQRVEMKTYYGTKAVCVLARAAPDALNPARQPVQDKYASAVMCGYYLWPEVSGAGSADRVFKDLNSTGVDALPRADGVYAFAYWDAREEELVTGVDKLGMRPLYWVTLSHGGYAVASEAKILVGLLDKLDTNWSAWAEQLVFGYLFGEHTLFGDIQRLGAAETITFSHSVHRSRVVESFLETISIRDRPVDDFVEEQCAVFNETMSQLTSLYDASDHTMLTLSGGIDSRRALGWLLNEGIQPEVYTVPNVQNDTSEFESAIVRDVVREAGIDATLVYPLTVADRIRLRQVRNLATDFQSDEHFVATTLAMGVSCHDNVNFDGLAAGSQLSGSFMVPEYFEAGGKERFISEWPSSIDGWIKLPSGHGASEAFAHARRELDRWGDNPNRFAYFYLLSRTRREVALAPLSLQTNVFESLCPYLDRRMMMSAFSFPPNKKVDSNLQLAMIDRTNPRLARLPSTVTRDISGNPRYRVETKGLEREARRAILMRAAYRQSSRSPWCIANLQQWRFRVAGLTAMVHYGQRVGWEVGKASKVSQLMHFESVGSSGTSYGAAVAELAKEFAAREDWCRPLGYCKKSGPPI